MTTANLFFLNIQHIGMDGVLSLLGDFGEFTATNVAFSSDHPNVDRKNNVFAGNLESAGRDIAFWKVVTAKTTSRAADIGQRIGVSRQVENYRTHRIWFDPVCGTMLTRVRWKLQVNLLFLSPEQTQLSG